MTYEEILDKYKPLISKRRNEIEMAESKVTRIKSILADWKQEREKYRQKGTTIDAERIAQWNRWTNEIRRMEQRLATAKDEAALLSLGGEDKLNQIINDIAR